MRPLTQTPQALPQRRDPAPSRLRYRLQRWWLTPHVRWLVRRGLPLALVLGAVGYGASLPQNRVTVVGFAAEIRAQIAARPELQVRTLRLTGVPEDLRPSVMAALDVALPVSTLDLKPLALKARIEGLDAVRAADVRVIGDGVLAIDVSVREPRVVLRTGAGLRLLDARGVPVADLERRADRADLPLIAGAGAQAAVAEALVLIEIAAPIAPRLRGLVRVGARRWDLVLDRDQAIRLPATGAAEALSRVMALNAADDILERDITIWDMRDPRRPILRLGAHARQELLRLRSPVVLEKI